MTNPLVKARFLPVKDNPEHFKEVRQHLNNFLAAGAGGPEQYTGLDMETAPRGMNIYETEHMAVMDDILDVLGEHKYDIETRKDISAIAYSLKDTMIRK